MLQPVIPKSYNRSRTKNLTGNITDSNPEGRHEHEDDHLYGHSSSDQQRYCTECLNRGRNSPISILLTAILDTLLNVNHKSLLCVADNHARHMPQESNRFSFWKSRLDLYTLNSMIIRFHCLMAAVAHSKIRLTKFIMSCSEYNKHHEVAAGPFNLIVKNYLIMLWPASLLKGLHLEGASFALYSNRIFLSFHSKALQTIRLFRCHLC